MKKIFPFLALLSCFAQKAVAQFPSAIEASPLPLYQLAEAADFPYTKGIRLDTGLRSMHLPPDRVSRWYSYAEYCSFEDADFVDNGHLPYLWNKADAMALYQDGSGGLLLDTLRLNSYGMTFDPAFQTLSYTSISGFYEPTIYDLNLIIRRSTDYRVDSVRVYGAYGRNLERPLPVDTLRVTVLYGGGISDGADMPLYEHTLRKCLTCAYDTLRFANMMYDSASNTAKGSSRIIRDVLLDSASVYDTLDGGLHVFAVPVGLDVPAGNVIGMSVSFISGDTYVPYTDTVFYGAARSANPFGRGMFRPMIFEHYADTFPKLWPGYYNIGMVKYASGPAAWKDMYLPATAFGAGFKYEIPSIDIKLSCTYCATETIVSDHPAYSTEQPLAYPNPSSSLITIPFQVQEEASVQVSIHNLLGQEITAQEMGIYKAGQKGQAVLSTLYMPNGIYLYTIEAGGQRIARCFSVLH